MTFEERQAIGRYWVDLAQIYGKEITRPAMSIILNAIQDLDGKKVLDVLQAWAAESKLQRHPLPSEIREKICPVLDDDTIARDTAAKIVGAVPKFGWQQGYAARAYIGELGWKAVERFGGWGVLCEQMRDTQVGTYNAQFRDQVKALMQLSRAGKVNEPAKLPQNITNKSVQKLVQKTIKPIEEQNDEKDE